MHIQVNKIVDLRDPFAATNTLALSIHFEALVDFFTGLLCNIAIKVKLIIPYGEFLIPVQANAANTINAARANTRHSCSSWQTREMQVVAICLQAPIKQTNSPFCSLIQLITLTE